MRKIFTVVALIALAAIVLDHAAFAQEKLRTDITALVNSVKGEVGVAIRHLETGDTLSETGDTLSETGDTLSVNGHHRFPMQSVFKFHLGLAVLHEVDRGKLRIDQKVFIDKKNLHPNTWSPIAKEFPEGNVYLTIRELLEFTVAQSDNNGCDILMPFVGGAAKLGDYIHSLGVKDVAIVYNEEEMAKGWDLQFSNWSTPVAMTQLLSLFYQGKILSSSSTNLLIEILKGTSTGPKRLRGQLPPGTIVAHKTGTGGANESGVLGALNDAGIITLPNGSHIAISVFISRTQDDPSTLELTIAKICKLTYDHYNAK